MLNAQEAIKSKTRLIVTDALFGYWGSSRYAFVPDFVANSLIVSTDPVAADNIGTEILDEERARHDKPPRYVPLLKKAAKMGLGASADEIWKVSMYMGTQVGMVSALSAAALPDALVVGRSTPLEVRVALDASRETTGSPRQMSVDLSPLGMPSELPLTDAGGGRYTGSMAVTPSRNGRYRLPVMLKTGGDEGVSLLTAALDVYPGGDLSIYEDGPSTGWTVQATRAESDVSSSKFVHSGSSSHAILLAPSALPDQVKYVFDDSTGVDPFGYSHLQLYVHGGEALGQDPVVIGKKLSDLGVVPQSDTWTLVSIPISEISLNQFDQWGRLTHILISGSVKETFYIDDMKLVAQPLPEPETAVEASKERTVPYGYVLSQNVPNPFNAQTTIPYALPKAGSVHLVVYDATGQRVRTLVDGHQQAGSYAVVWDGKDGAGRDVASGVYLVRLEVGAQSVRARRMVLIR